MKIDKLYIYPIKSLGGIEMQSLKTGEQGFQYDRMMLLTDLEGNFLSQRSHPKMALIGSELCDGFFCFYDKRNKENFINIPLNIESNDQTNARVWKHHFTANRLDKLFSSWFENFLSTKLELLKIGPNSNRLKSISGISKKIKLSAADGYPYLVVSKQSLEDLNKRLEIPVSMDRFRPNIVLDLDEPYQEEEISQFETNSVKIRHIKPCARCIMTTIDQKTGEKLVEPLKTLSTYKKAKNKIFFGMNAIVMSNGLISKEDTIQILA